MNEWAVDFMVEPTGREVSIEVEADSGKEAMFEALTRLELEPDELLHTVSARIGPPR
jgi:hypothetical protein